MAKAKLAAKHRRGGLPESDGGTRPIESDGLATVQPLPWVAKPVRALGDLFSRRKPTVPVEWPSEQPAPKKCKGRTIVYGDATVAGKKATVAAGDKAVASHVEKNAGPAVIGSDSSTQNALLGAGNLANVPGNGNNLPQSNTPPQLTFLQKLQTDAGKAFLWLVGIGAVVTFLMSGGPAWLVGLVRRRKTSTENQA